MFNIDEITIDKETSGVWAPFKGSEFLIASSGCTKFQRLFAKLQMPHRKAIERKKLDPEIQMDLMARSLSMEIVKDWKDVVDNSGKAVDFTVKSAYDVLRGNSEFREFVTEFASEISNYVSEEKEELGKSVEVSSIGKSSTDQD